MTTENARFHEGYGSLSTPETSLHRILVVVLPDRDVAVLDRFVLPGTGPVDEASGTVRGPAANARHLPAVGPPYGRNIA